MQLNVIGHHVEITESMRAYVEKRLDRIKRHFDHVIDVQVLMSVDKLQHKAEATRARARQQHPRRSHRHRHVCRHRCAGRQARPQRAQAQGKAARPPCHGRTARRPPVSPAAMKQRMRLILVSGLSGSGKSVALHMLEDLGLLLHGQHPRGAAQAVRLPHPAQHRQPVPARGGGPRRAQHARRDCHRARRSSRNSRPPAFPARCCFSPHRTTRCCGVTRRRAASIR